MTAPLLDLSGLRVTYPGRGFRARPHEVLHGVSLLAHEGETLGIVGESGSGKTTLGRAVLGLVTPSGGHVRFRGRDITHASRKERRALARDIQVVFQDPYSSLNPALAVGDILSEPLTTQGATTREARARIAELLDQVGLPKDAARRLPREFSGGQRQRVAIARALASEPSLIVCDEPVSALDLTTRARVLDLFVDIQRRTSVAYLFISHDLAVIRHVSHRVSVMRGGEIVETGDAGQVTSLPRHPYTQMLLLAAPVPDPVAQRERRQERHRLLAREGAEPGAVQRVEQGTDPGQFGS
ncbi:ATP-binding cassette domain-containing protein [Streptomyces sp. ME18-1-4]|uniref:ATP-binding cassette domain-containing protein n=1 Tax=Streptomyces sp. ME18-1-4 TaxID=3028685 RepID=UPI0029A8369D|nr:ATP-binding cassette domain-containing protein [Streptomyces sp. ME18-1-4]MDX3240437.1 ATP-binding cassette domain-containing protein [Streptomyces sp. ME18-1-4]